jgi:hypothetical protein
MSATITREMLAERWRMATTDVQRWADGDLTQSNGKRWQRADDSLHELAVRLVDEVMGDAERMSLLQLTEGIWEEIERRTIAWALEVHAARAAREKRAA